MFQKQSVGTWSKRRVVKKSLFGLLTILLIFIALLASAVLNPTLFYSDRTLIGKFTVYHSNALDPAFPTRLLEAAKLVEKSELQNPSLQFNICLGESAYPKFIKLFFGDAFAWGFYNTVVINGKVDSKNNRHESGWHLSQLIAHEMTHCLQFDKLGLFHSNPIARYPEWKWEGYPEFIARSAIQESFDKSIERVLSARQTENTGWMTLPNGTQTSVWYYKSWLLVKYCLETKKMNYSQLLEDTVSQESLRKEMMQWYEKDR